MANPDVKQWTLAVVNVSRKEFETFIKNIPAEERKATGRLKQWSAKDEIAHLTFWLETFVKNIQARRSGKPGIDITNHLALNDKA